MKMVKDILKRTIQADIVIISVCTPIPVSYTAPSRALANRVFVIIINAIIK